MSVISHPIAFSNFQGKMRSVPKELLIVKMAPPKKNGNGWWVARLLLQPRGGGLCVLVCPCFGPDWADPVTYPLGRAVFGPVCQSTQGALLKHCRPKNTISPGGGRKSSLPMSVTPLGNPWRGSATLLSETIVLGKKEAYVGKTWSLRCGCSLSWLMASRPMETAPGKGMAARDGAEWCGRKEGVNGLQVTPAAEERLMEAFPRSSLSP